MPSRGVCIQSSKDTIVAMLHMNISQDCIVVTFRHSLLGHFFFIPNSNKLYFGTVAIRAYTLLYMSGMLSTKSLA